MQAENCSRKENVDQPFHKQDGSQLNPPSSPGGCIRDPPGCSRIYQESEKWNSSYNQVGGGGGGQGHLLNSVTSESTSLCGFKSSKETKNTKKLSKSHKRSPVLTLLERTQACPATTRESRFLWPLLLSPNTVGPGGANQERSLEPRKLELI